MYYVYINHPDGDYAGPFTEVQDHPELKRMSEYPFASERNASWFIACWKGRCKRFENEKWEKEEKQYRDLRGF